MQNHLALTARYVLGFDPERFVTTDRGSLIDQQTGQEYWAEPVLTTIDPQEEAQALTSGELTDLGLTIQVEGVGLQ
jgi:hypothetical protein